MNETCECYFSSRVNDDKLENCQIANCESLKFLINSIYLRIVVSDNSLQKKIYSVQWSLKKVIKIIRKEQKFENSLFFHFVLYLIIRIFLLYVIVAGITKHVVDYDFISTLDSYDLLIRESHNTKNHCVY